MAAEKHATATQLAPAWILYQGPNIVPIPGTKKVPYLEENVGALNVRLTEQDIRPIAEALPKGVAAGERYPDMITVNR